MRRFWILSLIVLLGTGCTPAGLHVTQPPPPKPAPSLLAPIAHKLDSPAQPTNAPQPERVTVNVSGDLLWHTTLLATARSDAAAKGAQGMDFAPQFSSLREYVGAADLAICHAEVPFAPEGGPYEGYPTFAAPPQIATTVKQLGWDACTTASNHTMDQGWTGLVRTIDTHEAAGLLTAGSYRSQAESTKPVIYTTQDGVRIGIVSQTFGLNGIPKAQGKDWSVNLLDANRAIADAARAKAAGADIVVVHMHAGDEYVRAPSTQQIQFAKAVTASEHVDLVFGQHAHVVQPIDKINGKWVIYGLGNLIATSGPARPHSWDGLMATVTFERKGEGFDATQLEWAPTLISRLGDGRVRVWLIPDEIAAGNPSTGALQASAARTRKVVTSLGAEGLTERGSQR